MNIDFSKLSERKIIKLIKKRDLYIWQVPEEFQTINVRLESVKINCNSLYYINKKTYELCLEAVKYHGIALEYVPKEYKTSQLCLEAVKNNGMALEFVENATIVENAIYEIQLEAVKKNGMALEFIKEQTEELCLTAVEQNGLALRFVKNQNNTLCLIAIKNNSYALEFMREQTEEICHFAIKLNPWAFQLVKNQTKDLCLLAIKQDPWNLQCVNKDLLQEVSKSIPDIKFFECKGGNLLCEKINGEWLFSREYDKQITRKQFLDIIYNINGGLDNKTHIKEYVDIINEL